MHVIINCVASQQDRRKEMTKSVAKLAEDGKVSIRYQQPLIPLSHSKWHLLFVIYTFLITLFLPSHAAGMLGGSP